MPKQKIIVKKHVVSLNQPQSEILVALMKEDLQTNVSGYFGILLAEVYKARTNKRGPGRPRKDDDDPAYDENAPRTIPHPELPGKFVNLYDLEILKARKEYQGSHQPRP